MPLTQLLPSKKHQKGPLEKYFYFPRLFHPSYCIVPHSTWAILCSVRRSSANIKSNLVTLTTCINNTEYLHKKFLASWKLSTLQKCCAGGLMSHTCFAKVAIYFNPVSLTRRPEECLGSTDPNPENTPSWHHLPSQSHLSMEEIWKTAKANTVAQFPKLSGPTQAWNCCSFNMTFYFLLRSQNQKIWGLKTSQSGWKCLRDSLCRSSVDEGRRGRFSWLWRAARQPINKGDCSPNGRCSQKILWLWTSRSFQVPHWGEGWMKDACGLGATLFIFPRCMWCFLESIPAC